MYDIKRFGFRKNRCGQIKPLLLYALGKIFIF